MLFNKELLKLLPPNLKKFVEKTVEQAVRSGNRMNTQNPAEAVRNMLEEAQEAIEKDNQESLEKENVKDENKEKDSNKSN